MAQRKFLIDGGFEVNDDSIITGDLTMTGNILPSVDSDGTTGYDLGSPTAKWRDLYLSSGSLYIDGQKVMESDSGTIVVQADPDQSLTTKTLGSGVLTFQSPNPISIAATLQMATGKRITSADGLAVVFGDKVDMDNNQIINLAAPTADGHATTKLYVDTLISNISTDAIQAGDTEVGIADLGTGTVGITVDGTQRFALTSTSLALTVPVTVNGVTLANTTYVDQAEADAKAYTDTRETAITTAYQTYADTAEADAKAYTDTRETVLRADFVAADTTQTVALQTYADQAEADAIATANSYTDGRETVLRADFVAADTTQTVALQSYADQAEADAKAYTDTAISNLVNGANASFDTLKEIQDAMATDAELSAAIAALTIGNGTQTISAGSYLTGGGSFTANQTSNTSVSIAVDATSANTASKVVARDASGNFSAGTITAALSGNASTATKWATSRTITLAGDASGTVSIDGSANATLTVTVANDSHTHDTRYVQPADLVHFHSTTQTVTSTQSATNVSSTVPFTFADLATAKHYNVYLNRMLLRPTTEYTVSGSTVTFAVGVLATDDEIEVSGLKLV